MVMRVTEHGPGEGDAAEPGLYDSCSYSPLPQSSLFLLKCQL